MHALEETNYSVNLEVFGRAFENTRIEVNKHMVMVSIKEVGGVKLAPAAIKNKLADCDNYNFSLINTHTAQY